METENAPPPEATRTAEQINAPQTGTVKTEATPPPAAQIVVTAEKSEREVELEAQLEAEKLARKKAETDAAHALDENSRLKQIPATAPGAVPKRKRKKGIMEEFIFGPDATDADESKP